MELPEKLKGNGGHSATSLKINKIISYLEEREGEKDPFKKFAEEQWGDKAKTIIISKPEWWEARPENPSEQELGYLEALTAASKASGINFELE